MWAMGEDTVQLNASSNKDGSLNCLYCLPFCMGVMHLAVVERGVGCSAAPCPDAILQL